MHESNKSIHPKFKFIYNSCEFYIFNWYKQIMLIDWLIYWVKYKSRHWLLDEYHHPSEKSICFFIKKKKVISPLFFFFLSKTWKRAVGCKVSVSEIQQKPNHKLLPTADNFLPSLSTDLSLKCPTSQESVLPWLDFILSSSSLLNKRNRKRWLKRTM